MAQEHQIAYQYLRNGSYEKAAAIYHSLQKKNPYNTIYTGYLVDCYQQLQRYDSVANLVTRQIKKFKNQEYLLIELGYSLQLQHRETEAIPFYEKALKSIEQNPGTGYIVGKTFQDNHLLDYALKAYEKTTQLNPNANFNFQIAFIYGEQGNIEAMFTTYLNMISGDDRYVNSVKNYLGRYITDDSENESNEILRKLLIKKAQSSPHPNWNALLSWLFIQEKEYFKALVQEKALFRRNPESLSNIIEVGRITFNNQSYAIAKDAFQFVLDETENIDEEITAKLYLLEIEMNTSKDHLVIENTFQALFNQYGKNEQTVQIQVVYATFLAFRTNQPEKAIKVIEYALQLPVDAFQKGILKTKLGDILLFSNKFNSALIYYTQVQQRLKNHTIGQTARFKIAQTSYFKGDFKWAQSQLKILKNSTSQLIANDALDLNLLITDNLLQDSLNTPLKKFAEASLLSFQNKTYAAIDTLEIVKTNYNGHPIEDEALFEQAKLYEKTEAFLQAEQNYLRIIALKKDDLLADDAHYYLAELYLNRLNNPEKAQEYYQKIIFEYPSSIYLVDARKKFRLLRGDAIN